MQSSFNTSIGASGAMAVIFHAALIPENKAFTFPADELTNPMKVLRIRCISAALVVVILRNSLIDDLPSIKENKEIIQFSTSLCHFLVTSTRPLVSAITLPPSSYSTFSFSANSTFSSTTHRHHHRQSNYYMQPRSKVVVAAAVKLKIFQSLCCISLHSIISRVYGLQGE